MPMPKVRHTRADYERLPEGVYAQLIEGELVMSPTPTPWHELLVARFIEELVFFLGRRSGRVLPSKFEIVAGAPPDEEIAQPDVAVLPPGTRPQGRSWRPPAPVLVAEILSPSTATYDRGAKLRIYAAADVREAWLLDPADETIEIHDLASGERRAFARGDAAESRAVPGFRVDVAAFFAA
jgi:Uma2 family endonuclease